jgi:hypothetical protein
VRALVVSVALAASAGSAHAGAFGKLGGGVSRPPTPADCSRLRPARQPIPPWSRLSWAVAAGAASRPTDGRWHASWAIVPQASYALWAREAQCASGRGLFRDDAWRRLSLGVAFDGAWRAAEPGVIDVRAAVRLARSTYDVGLLHVGSHWTPSWELAVTAGPTFDPRWSGGAVSFGARASVLSFEVRVAARTAGGGPEVMALMGITDVHGLWKLGPDREYVRN